MDANTDKDASERRVWTPQEDEAIARLVAEHGNKAWSTVASFLPTRTGKQCRERWHNHLDPDINKADWSEEEDRALIETHRSVGNRWAEIARALPGRTDNQVKNRWNSALRRELRKLNRLASKQTPQLIHAMTAVTAAVAAASGSEAIDDGPGSRLAGADNLSDELKALIPVTEPPKTKAAPKKRQTFAQLSAAAAEAMVCPHNSSERINLDTRCPLPFGVYAEDQENATELLEHMAGLNSAWFSEAPAIDESCVPEEAMPQVSAHFEWLQNFCRRLVERSLVRKQEASKQPDDGKRKRRRRGKAAIDSGATKAAGVVEGTDLDVADNCWDLGPLAASRDDHVGHEGAMPLAKLPDAFNVDELLTLVGQEGPRALPTNLLQSPRGAPLVSLYSPTLGSPLAITESDFSSCGALSSPERFLSPREVEALQQPSSGNADSGVLPPSEEDANGEMRRVRRCSHDLRDEEEEVLDAELHGPSLVALGNSGQGAGLADRRRPDGATNLQIGLQPPRTNDSTVGSLASGGGMFSVFAGTPRNCGFERPTTARLAAMLSPSLLSPSIFNSLLTARTVC